MSLRSRIILPVILTAFGILAGCGGSSKPIPTPPPSGGFTASNLNGTYIFSTSGTDTNGTPIMIVGAFTACGCTGGTISGGAISFDDGSTGVVSNQPITGGTYSVTQDGRGQARLLNSSSLGTITLDFVLESSSGGSVTEFDGNGSGSGSLELQSTVAQSDINGQSYAFLFPGIGANGLLFSTAGAFTLDSTGAVSTGVQDVVNLNQNATTGMEFFTAQQALAIATSSTVAVGSGATPGTAQISDVGGSVLTFDVYAISPAHLKFVETDGLQLTSGDVLAQQTSLPTGTLAFTMSGVDTSLLPFSAGGLLPMSSSTINAGTEDFNDGGITGTSSTVGGSFSTLSGGRSVLSLSSFENGATNAVLGSYTFAAYPSTGGTILLEVDSAGISGGIALAQSSTSFAGSQGYGVNLSGVNLANTGFFEEDDIAEFTTTSSGFSGLIDFNDQGATAFDKSFSGNYQSLSTGRYSLTSNDFNGNFYTVDGSTILFLEMDSNQVGTGVFQVQSTPAAAALSHPHTYLSVPRVVAHTRVKRNK